MTINGFQAHCFAVFGAAVVGIGLTVWFGWPVALGWLLGWGIGMGLIQAIACGYIRFSAHPKRSL